MQGIGVEVPHVAFAREPHRRAERRGERLVDRRIAGLHPPAVRERDFHVALSPGAEAEKPVDAAEAARVLAAAELAFRVPDGEHAIADHAAVVDFHCVALLAEHRLDRIAPQRHDMAGAHAMKCFS